MTGLHRFYKNEANDEVRKNPGVQKSGTKHRCKIRAVSLGWKKEYKDSKCQQIGTIKKIKKVISKL